jgi:hypothetical protein
VYDTLLFLHVLSAFVAFVTVAVFAAYAFGVPVDSASFRIADLSWNVSGAGLLVFGVWLALYVDGYELWDGWILGALALFAATAVFGSLARNGALAAIANGGERTARRADTWHWLRTAAVVGILVLMIWKPGA